MRSMDNVDDVEIQAAMKSVQGTWKHWLLVFLVGGAGGYGIYHLRNELLATKNEMIDADARSTKKQAELLAAKGLHTELEARIDELEKTNAAMVAIKERADAEAIEKERSRATLTSVSSSIATSLAAEIATRDAVITLEDARIVVDISEKVLFDGPEPLISKKGEDVLARIGTQLATIPDHRLEIVGHTETAAVPDKVKATIPSAWELSALHAAAVARRLIEFSKLKDSAILISAAAATQPNKAAKTKARNRRIEVLISSPTTNIPQR
jgi:chemotaxis protein MotB